MKTYLKILVLVFLFISFGIAKFYAIWPHLKEIYTSPELKDSLSRVPEDIHRLAPLDESNTRTFSLGYASFKLPQDVDAFLFRREEDAISIWFYGEQLKLNFERPLAVTHLYEMESFVKITNLTKTEWRQSRLLKATDDFDHTLVSLPDLILYYFQEIPLSYFRIFLM
nr:hypothetical protein [bacterium]